jgi:hypothetical protein
MFEALDSAFATMPHQGLDYDDVGGFGGAVLSTDPKTSFCHAESILVGSARKPETVAVLDSTKISAE